MKELLLHIGHSKTGSSFVQSALANSHDRLAEQGIDYYRGSAGAARDWQISSGNGQTLILDPIEGYEFSADRVLFSAEQFFRALTSGQDFKQKLEQFCDHYGFGRVRMLLFIRDPIPHAESSYQQMIKRGGATGSSAGFFDRYKQPELVQDLLENAPNVPELEMTVLNYDRHRSSLADRAEAFLGVAPGTLAAPEAREVNRSMTRAELALQAAINEALGDAGGLLSDALCNSLPDIRAERAFPSVEVQDRMLSRLAPAIEAVNAKVPVSERYDLTVQTPGDVTQDLAFSSSQIEVIGRTLGARIAELQALLAVERSRRQLTVAEAMIAEGRDSDAMAILRRVRSQLKPLTVDGPSGDTVQQLRRKVAKLLRKAA